MYIKTPWVCEFMYVDIKNSNYETVLTIRPEQIECVRLTSSEFYACVKQGIYTVTASTPSTDGTGWTDGGYMNIYLYDVFMSNIILPNGEGPHSIDSTLYLKYNIDVLSEWEYNNQYVDGWKNSNFAGSWSKSRLSELPQLSGNTIYLRKKVPLENVDSFSSFYTRLNIKSGLIFSLGNLEVYRVNVPEGDITASQAATSSFNDFTKISFVLPIQMFEEGDVIVSLELHKESEAESLSGLKFIAIDLQGDGILYFI